MLRFPTSFRIIAIAAVLMCLASTPRPASAQDTVTVDLPQARLLARTALSKGQTDLARHIALGLLQADAADYVALVILSAAESQRGDQTAAIRAGKRAFGAARTAAQRYEAATLIAQAMATKGQHTGAKFWLRRAAQNAPAERYRKAAEQNHWTVARNAPLAFRFTVSVSPTSNVNNGSRHDTILIFGLPFTLSGASQALSGTEAIFGISGDYRIAATSRSTTELRFGAVSRVVTLSEKAKALAPEVRGSDFTFAAVETGVAHRFRAGASPAIWSLGATAGHSWYGGRDLADYLRLEAGSEIALTPTRSLKFSASAVRQWRQDLTTRSADVLSLGADVAQVLANGDRVTLGVGLSDTGSQAADIDHTALRAQVDWRQGQSIAGLRLGANFSAQSARYGGVALAPQGRNDLRLGAEISATFENLDYMGFAPTLSVNATDNRSNVVLYDGRNYGIQFGVKSTF